jgi:lipoyl-dependent peroxiredoxin
MTTRISNAEWQGDLKSGSGKLSTGSNILRETKYTFAARFEEERGTNPEELLGAAYAACFCMALAGDIAKKGYMPNSVKAEAKVILEKTNTGFAIRKIVLECEGDVPDMDEETFKKLAESTKDNCIIASALSSVEREVKARLTVEQYNG